MRRAVPAVLRTALVLIAAASVTAPAVFGQVRIAGVEEHEKATKRPLTPELARFADYYIVQLEDPALPSYKGGLLGLRATSNEVTGARKLDPRSNDSRAYRAYLAAKQDIALEAMAASLGRGMEVMHRYDAALNGFAVRLDPHEVATVRALPGVISVQRNEFRELDTDVGPQWIGAPTVWNGPMTPPALITTKGEGMVVGIIDSGINADHPSFADLGGDGFDHTNPYGAGVYPLASNKCVTAPATYVCNDKLVGQFSYASSGNIPEDDDGHGSHTASTAAGNALLPAVAILTSPSGFSFADDISGVAPHANIVAFDACAGSCPTAALVAAANDAILFGSVDVINYSISGGNDPYTDSVSLAFLNATNAGIFVSCSAGNSGPGPSTNGHSEPWVQSVAASTHNRKFVNSLTGMVGGDTTPPADIVGASFTGALAADTIVYAGDYGDPFCPLGAFAAGTWTNGEIVVCDRGAGVARLDKALSVQAGGAAGFVLANDAPSGASLVEDAYAIPGVHITHAAGVVLKTWLDTGSGHMAAIAGTTGDYTAANGDVVASFSSRGPSGSLPDVIKPDVAAPGVNVWAADNDSSTAPATPAEFQLLSGTSMASPHSAGAAALVRAQRPTWTPSMVKSAMMMTAKTAGVLKEDGVTAATPFDRGTGRVDLTKASLAGFVLDETYGNYLAANPLVDGDPTQLNLASLADNSCFQTCTWSRTVLSTLAVSTTVKTWTGTISAPPGVVVSITSANPFALTHGGARTVNVKVDVTSAAKEQWHFATITWSDGAGNSPDLVWPIAVWAMGSTEGLTLSKSVDLASVTAGTEVTYTINVANRASTPQSYDVVDPLPAFTTFVPGSETGGITYNAGPERMEATTPVMAGLDVDVLPGTSPFGYLLPNATGMSNTTNLCTLSTQCDETLINLTGVDYFYLGVRYNNLRLMSNGLVIPGTAAGSDFFTNQLLPDPTDPDNVIAALWADFDLDGSSGSDPGAGTYYYSLYTDPTPPNQQYYVITWLGAQLYNNPTQTYTFQIWIKKGTDKIWFVYQDLDAVDGLPDGAEGGVTIGAENSNGTSGGTRFYRALGSCDPTCAGDTGTAPTVGQDLEVVAVAQSTTYTFKATVDDNVIANSHIQNVVTATNGTTSYEAVADSFVDLDCTGVSDPTITAPLTATPGQTGLNASVPVVVGTTYDPWSIHNWANADLTSLITAGQGTEAITFDAAAPGTTMFLGVDGQDVDGCPLTAERRLQVEFNDVPSVAPFYGLINTLAAAGVTAGCGNGDYCPGSPVQRDQMAIFLLKAFEGAGYDPADCTSDPFLDVTTAHPFCQFIQELSARGITAGCGNGNYCPSDSVTREQMALFLLKTLEGNAYVPPVCTVPVFNDVPCASFFAPWINELADRGITSGCGNGDFCPGDSVTRGQMAAFLVTTFGLTFP